MATEWGGFLAWACALALVAASSAGAAVDVRGEQGEYLAHLPDGFAPVLGTRPGVRVFSRRREGGEPVVVTLRSLQGTLRNEPFDEGAARAVVQARTPGAEVRVERERAMGVEVPVLLARVPGGEATALATLPAMPRAVQVVVTGAATDEAEVRRVAHAVVRGFEARTNWLTAGEVARKRAAQGLLGVAWALLGAYALAWVVRFRRGGAGGKWQAAWLLASGGAFLGAAGLLASVPRGASAFEPVTPALVGVVLVANALVRCLALVRAPSRMGIG